ncbi:MAG: LysM domain-containing protein, partial [Sphingorhabdus sp.]|uniref:LysM peptidoglycan-binding domain-containing protein n=1 Tax=Sphingorhabdus sp. TaxID=1902408 RepID=UPI003C8A628B
MPKSLAYLTDMNGQVIRRDETRTSSPGQMAPHEIFYRFAGRQTGMVGNNGTMEVTYEQSVKDRSAAGPTISDSNAGLFRGGTNSGTVGYADFAQSIGGFNSYAQASATGSYTVRAGDTLASIAAQLYGDANLWYRLAEANGLSSQASLIEGQTLVLPTGVTRSKHNAGTFKPYDAAEATGDLNPTTPKPPKKAKCGGFGQLILTAIAIAVAVLIAGPGAPLLAQIGAAVAGSVVSQG